HFEFDEMRETPPPLFTRNNHEALISAAPRGVAVRAIRILKWVELETNYFGEDVSVLPERDYPIGYAKNEHEFVSLLKYLKERGLLAVTGTMQHWSLTLTARGYEELDALRRSNAESQKGFVAMWFNQDMEPIFTNAI